jgi:hypothetical protein
LTSHRTSISELFYHRQKRKKERKIVQERAKKLEEGETQIESALARLVGELLSREGAKGEAHLLIRSGDALLPTWLLHLWLSMCNCLRRGRRAFYLKL